MGLTLANLTVPGLISMKDAGKVSSVGNRRLGTREDANIGGFLVRLAKVFEENKDDDIVGLLSKG
jgi:hypothetical protein